MDSKEIKIEKFYNTTSSPSYVGYSEDDSYGNCGYKIPEMKKNVDMVLYKLDDFDKNYYKDIKVKSGQIILRYETDVTKITNQRPLVKINPNKGLIYFVEDLDAEEPVFETRGTKLVYLNVFN